MSKAALIVLAESVDVVPVFTDSSELDSVWTRVEGRSDDPSSFAGSKALPTAAARICCF
jgi:hypothetical protein